MDGIWLTFSVVLNFLLLGWTLWVDFQNERLMCFHNRQKRNGHSWTCCYSNTICKCDGRNWLFHFFRPSNFKDCVAIAMCLIVALFFPFLIEVCWLLYCVLLTILILYWFIGDLNGLGHLPRICRPDRTGNESGPGRNCQQMQMYGTRVKENFRKYSLSERVNC